MMKKQLVYVLFLAAFLTLLTGCSSSKEELQDSQKKVTEQDMKKKHITLDLMEKVMVDADITPYSEYQDGLNSYYLETSFDHNGSSDIKAYKKNPVLFNQPVEKIAGYIEEYLDGEFDMSKEEIDVGKEDIHYTVPFQCARKEKLGIDCWWVRDENKKFAGTEFYFIDLNRHNTGYDFIGKVALEDAPFYEKVSLDFMDRDEASAKMKRLVEQIIGRKINDKVECVPVTESFYHEIMSYEKRDEKEMPYQGDYYVCLLYLDVDGFPWKNLDLNLSEENGMKLSKKVAVRDETCFSRNEWAMAVAYDKKGLISLELDSFFCTGKVYKEKEKVCTLSEVLGTVENYFKDIIIEDSLTIYEISLAYSSYFTNPEDGVMENAVRPFWVVKYWDRKTAAKQLVFDAYSGKFVGEHQVG